MYVPSSEQIIHKIMNELGKHGDFLAIRIYDCSDILSQTMTGVLLETDSEQKGESRGGSPSWCCVLPEHIMTATYRWTKFTT